MTAQETNGVIKAIRAAWLAGYQFGSVPQILSGIWTDDLLSDTAIADTARILRDMKVNIHES